jgi:hypothetical protein
VPTVAAVLAALTDATITPRECPDVDVPGEHPLSADR